MYDNNRKLSETGNDTTPESSCGLSDMEGKTKRTAEQRHLAVGAKTTCSNIFGKTRSRRTLPNLPNHVTNGNVAERRKRLSDKFVEKSDKINSETVPEFRIDDDDLNVESIESSVTRSNSDTSSENSRQVALEKDVVFQPVDPPDKVIGDSRQQNPDIRDSTKPNRVPLHDHVSESPASRTPIQTRTLNGMELPKPVPKLASALSDRLPVTSSCVRDAIEGSKPLTLHGLLRSCDLYHVTLRLVSESERLPKALQLIASSFEHSDNRYCPCGKIPLLGRSIFGIILFSFYSSFVRHSYLFICVL